MYEKIRGEISLPEIVFLLAPWLAGLYYEELSALVSLALLGWLGHRLYRTGKWKISVNDAFPAAWVLVFSFLLTTLWAVDKGMAPLGFVKFLPLPLFSLAMMQLEEGAGGRMLRRLPLNGAAMVLFSLLLGQIPALKGFFFENGRLHGFFQYANSFALFLLLGLPPLFRLEKWETKEILTMLILMAGIGLSGSRTTLLIMGGLVLFNSWKGKGKKQRFLPLGALGMILTAGILYGLITGDVSALGRVLTFSFSSSTLNGRILYDWDALPLILRHPFGLGYYGYFFIQGSVQSGVYSVVNVHNEWLQLFLDTGWIPALVWTWALIKGFLRGDSLVKTMLFLLCLHALTDFDFQFVALGLLLMLLLQEEKGPQRIWKKKAPLYTGLLLLLLICLYGGTASLLGHMGKHQAAVKLYPGHTLSRMELLKQTDTAEAMEAQAEAILGANRYASLAWTAGARGAFGRLDFTKMIEYKRKAISLARYSLEEYLDYADMLRTGWSLFEEAGDVASASFCREELERIPLWMQETLEGTSYFGWRINDKPLLELPAEYAWLEELNAGK